MNQERCGGKKKEKADTKALVQHSDLCFKKLVALVLSPLALFLD